MKAIPNFKIHVKLELSSLPDSSFLIAAETPSPKMNPTIPTIIIPKNTISSQILEVI